VRSLKDLPPQKALLASFKKAAEAAADRKTKLPRKEYQTPKPPLAVPADLTAALRKNKSAQKTFDGFSPSSKREYVEWIIGAKQDETRQRRLVQAVEWMAEGKSRNWKYER
jgi:uncharacterized protein YdeI (YjbR/CyaY-like superfamily)